MQPYRLRKKSRDNKKFNQGHVHNVSKALRQFLIKICGKKNFNFLAFVGQNED